MASKSEILPEIEALAVHCRPSLMTVEVRAIWLRDWCDDLAEFPIEAIRAGVRAYRHSGATKFPTPGQLVPMIRAGQPSQTGPKLDVWREAGVRQGGADVPQHLRWGADEQGQRQPSAAGRDARQPSGVDRRGAASHSRGGPAARVSER